MKHFYTFILLSFFLLLGNLNLNAQTSYVSGVPYLNQNCNSNNPSGTCQITSMAMMLQAYGVNVAPDDIYNMYYYGNAKDVPGWTNMFNNVASAYGADIRVTGYQYATVSELRSTLAEGKPVNTFGWFTTGGHIVLIVGFDGSNYIVNDPYGKWNEVIGSYSSVYCGSTAGKYVKYSASAFENAILENGTLWMNVPTYSLDEGSVYCSSKGSNTVGEWIEQFSLGAFTKTSGNNQGYADYTSNVIYVSQGESYQISITPGFSSQTYTEYSRVWIDLNQDGDFEDSGELLFSQSGSSTMSGTLTIPATATPGNTRMRISMKGDANPTACETFSYGEVEDYTVNIAENAVSYSLTIDNPSEAQVGTPVTFSGTATNGVQNVIISVDGYQIADALVNNGTYSTTYTFNSTGSNRQIIAKGMINNTQVVSNSSTITISENSSANLSLTHPSTTIVGQSVTFSGTASGGIDNVIISVDGYQIGNVSVVNGNYNLNYTFNGTGTNRVVVANGFDNGTSVAQKQSYITVNESSDPQTWGEIFAENVLNNSVAYENEAWGDITSGTPCVAFVAVGLRNHPTHNFPNLYPKVTEGPASESCSLQLDCTLEGTGYFDGPYYDLSQLQKGDIVFTERTVQFNGSYYSSHAMIFYQWSTQGSTSYAKFLDYHNERGLPYERNVTVSGTYDKSLFYYRYNADGQNTVPNSNLTITNPSTGTVGQAVSFTGTASSDIDNVVVSVDGWEIANVQVSNGQYSFNYTFNGVGSNRNIVANGFSNGVSIKEAYSTITINDSKSSNNNLGIWLWYIQNTAFASHADLADELKSMGVKRIYVKVADGSYDPSTWPEVNDQNLVNTYKNAGLEVYAWSYNYPGNEEAQANALYYAAKAGYDGYVMDIEIEFNGKTTELHTICNEFVKARTDAQNAGYADSDFKLACTSWGNPKDHNMNVDIIDQYVDFHMPQTYTEVWGVLSNQEYYINLTEDEYKNDYGCTKPIYHICAAEKGEITTNQINEFINVAGPNTSIWVVPNPSMHSTIWPEIKGVNWNPDFTTSIADIQSDFDAISEETNIFNNDNANIMIYPNPMVEYINIELKINQLSDIDFSIYTINGQIVEKETIKNQKGSIHISKNISDLSSGQYIIKIDSKEFSNSYKIQKIK